MHSTVNWVSSAEGTPSNPIFSSADLSSSLIRWNSSLAITASPRGMGPSSAFS